MSDVTIENAPVDEPVLSDVEQHAHDIEVRHKAELAGLNRKNSELQEKLKSRELAGASVEERINALELDRDSAVRRAEAVEAFGQAGLKDEWRQLFSVKDPTEQAGILNTMLSEYKQTITKEMAGEFSRSPDDIGSPGKSSFTMRQLEGKSPKEINQLYAEGRIVAG